MSQVVTELVIDADTSGADRYIQAMDRSADASTRGMTGAQQMALAVAGVSVATVGALAGLRSFVDYVGNQTQALVDMQLHADLAGLSVKEFQETLYAAKSAGLKEADFTAGLDRITQDLTDASRGVTQFGRLFEANGLTIRNANGELKSTKEAVADLANLMAQATPQQQQAMTRIVGISQAWIPFLRQGADVIEQQKQKAADLGIIIDDATIAKARQFNGEWNTAVAAWDLQFKASLASILPQMIQLANIAKEIINGIGSFASDFTRLFTPMEQMSVPQLDAQINSLHKFRDTIEDLQRSGQQQGVSEGILEKALGLPPGATLNDIDKLIDRTSQQIDKLKQRIRVTPNESAGINLPALSDQKDAVDRAIDSLAKHNLAVKADAESVGLGAGALARFRAEAAETAAVLANGGKETDEQRAKFKQLQEEAEDLAAGLAKIKIDNLIEFGQKTAFLSPEDVQIARQLAELYDNDIPTALASTEAAQLRVINLQKEMKDSAVDFAKTFAQGLLQGKSAMDSLVGAADQLSSKLLNSGIENLLSFDPAQMIKGGLQIGASALISAFTGDQKKREEEAKALKEAQDAWAKMKDQVIAFNHAAAGFDLGPITQNIQSLVNSYTQLAEAANKAKEYGSVAQLQATFNLGLNRLVNSFIDGTPVMTDLQQKMKAVMNEGQGMIETLISLGAATDATIRAIQDSINRQQSDLQRAFIAETEASLLADVRNNAGLGYLNTIGEAIKTFNDDIAQGISGGVAAAWLYSTAQAAIDSAGLTGQAVADLVAMFPQLSGAVHDSAKAIEDAANKIKAINDDLKAKINSLSGRGYLNDFGQLFADQTADLAAGADPALVSQYFKLQAQAIVDGAKLSGDAFANLVGMFPQLQGVVHAFIDTSTDAADALLRKNQQLQQFLDELRGGSASTAAPVDRLAASQEAYIRNLAAYRSGSIDVSALTQSATSFRTAARDFYGSTQGYQDIDARIQSDIAGLISGGFAAAGLPVAGTSIASPTLGVSAPAPASTFANFNFASAFTDLSGKVVALQAAVSAALDANTKAIGLASADEVAQLKAINSNTATLPSAGALALALKS